MNKKIGVVICTLALIMGYSATFWILKPALEADLMNFEYNAKEALGTDDYVLEMSDMLIARTKDGRQYPSEEVENVYYQNKLKGGLIGLSSAIVLLLVMHFVLPRIESKEKREV